MRRPARCFRVTYHDRVEFLLEVFSQHYESGFTLLTSNPPFDEWTEGFGSKRLTARCWKGS